MHTLKHDMEKLRPFKCNLCKDYSATTKHNLQSHIDRVHLKLKPFKCHLCEDRSYALNHELQKHINDVHKNLRPFKCHLCEDCKFTTNRYLQSHIDRVHLKLKPFKCHLCKDSYASNQELQRHINGKHLKLKPFKCHLCNTFSCPTNQELQRHINGVHKKLSYRFVQPHKYCKKHNRIHCKICKPMDCLRHNLRTRVQHFLRDKNFKKNHKTEEMLGCTYDFFNEHIQRKIDYWNLNARDGHRKFEQGDEYHIDHIKPLSMANNEQEMMKLCHYTNLQPLWPDTNISKKDRWNSEDEDFWTKNIYLNEDYRDIYLSSGIN